MLRIDSAEHPLLAAELEIHGDTDQVCILMTPWAASPASSSSERPSPESTSRVCSPSVGGGRKSISRPPSQRIGAMHRADRAGGRVGEVVEQVQVARLRILVELAQAALGRKRHVVLRQPLEPFVAISGR